MKRIWSYGVGRRFFGMRPLQQAGVTLLRPLISQYSLSQAETYAAESNTMYHGLLTRTAFTAQRDGQCQTDTHSSQMCLKATQLVADL